MKKCARCGKIKPFSEFVKDSRRPHGAGSPCRECFREKMFKWANENREHVREKDKEYRLANIDAYRERKKKWWEENQDKKKEYERKWYAENRDKKIGWVRRYRENNPDKEFESSRRKRAQKISCGGAISAEEWRNLKKLYNNTCLCCGRSEPEIRLTLDHVKPLKMGGSNTIDNAQPLCVSCNSRKGARYIDYRI